MDLHNIIIKESKKSDLDDVLYVEQQAFGSIEEAELTNNLLDDPSAQPVVSLLAFKDNQAVGHILFTKAKIEGYSPSPLVYILAPLAVIPEYQKQGIGGILIKHGIGKLREMGVELVFVLGHIDYYPKHGFINNAESFGYPAPYPIPEKDADAWMIQSLIPDGVKKYSGKIICADAMDKPEYWRE